MATDQAFTTPEYGNLRGKYSSPAQSEPWNETDMTPQLLDRVMQQRQEVMKIMKKKADQTDASPDKSPLTLGENIFII
jgi:hypothetical protein